MMGREKRRSLLLSLSPYPSHLTLPFSVPVSPCALLACCMKMTRDESDASVTHSSKFGGMLACVVGVQRRVRWENEKS